MVTYNRFFSLVVAKIKRGHGWKSFYFETSNTRRKLTGLVGSGGVLEVYVIKSTAATAQLHVHIILQQYSETSVKEVLFLTWRGMC